LAGTSSARRGGSASIGRREWMSTRPSRESMPAWCAVQVFWLPSLPPSPAPPPSSSSAPRRAGCRAVPSPRLPALPHHARHRHPAPLPQNPHLPLAPWLVFGSSAHTPVRPPAPSSTTPSPSRRSSAAASATLTSSRSKSISPLAATWNTPPPTSLDTSLPQGPTQARHATGSAAAPPTSLQIMVNREHVRRAGRAGGLALGRHQ